MIIIIAKKIVNGRWANINGEELYSIGQLIDFANGQTYIVTAIVGSKVTLEEHGVVSANE